MRRGEVMIISFATARTLVSPNRVPPGETGRGAPKVPRAALGLVGPRWVILGMLEFSDERFVGEEDIDRVNPA